ncbi:MAG: hypothetical protein HY648_02175 [Acidobacteria bacterium]|nr:hypothetical protein [Acidobacteriota bacterium]
MSRASFPRSEHQALLRDRIEQWLTQRNLDLEFGERGLDHYHCRYRFAFRRPLEEWVEFAVHFQVAERMEAGRGEMELARFLERFVGESFSGSEKA